MKDRPDLFYRFLAKGFDLALAGGLCFLFQPIGNIFGIIYILLSDATPFLDGASPMKWLVGLRTVDKTTGSSCSIKESVLRNLPFGFAAVLLLIPVLGIVLCLLVALIFIAVESYFLYTDPDGMRLGDVMADTHVIRSRPMRLPWSRDDDDDDDDLDYAPTGGDEGDGDEDEALPAMGEVIELEPEAEKKAEDG